MSVLPRLIAALVLTLGMSAAGEAAPTARSVLNGRADFAEAVYADAAAAAAVVREAVDGFLGEPDAAKLATTQAAFGRVLIPLRHAEGAGLGEAGDGGLAELLLGGTAADFSMESCVSDCGARRDRLKAAADGFAAQLEEKAAEWGKDGDARKALGKDDASVALERVVAALEPKAASLQKMPLSRAEAEALYQRQFGVASLYNGYYRRAAGGSVKSAAFGAYAREKAPGESRVLEQALTQTTLALEALRRQASAPSITDEALITRAREATDAQAKAAQRLGEALKPEAK